MTTGIVNDMLKSVGVRNMMTDSDEGESSDEDIKFDVNWIQRVVSNAHKRAANLDASLQPKKKRKRRWKCRRKLPYSVSMFYRDYHNPSCQKLGTMDAKEFRLNYRMPWTEVRKLVRLFARKKWVITQKEIDQRRVGGLKVCPPEVKILGTLYWLGEGCSFHTIYNVSGRVLSSQSFCDFAKKFCKIVRTHLTPRYIKLPETVEDLRRIEKAYTERGFPGAVGSTDGVQIAW